jgi:peptidoglycan/LPS O-acetylase OafA/YrhL
VFFVLSGFLITGLLLEERQHRGSISLRHFYARRAFRLLPALGLLLLTHLAYVVYEGLPLKREAEALLSITFYASDISQSLHMFIPTELGHTWSLAVEEQFYLVWPSLLLMLLAWRSGGSSRSRTLLPWVFGATLLATNIARVLTWRAQGYPAAYMMPYCHADGLIIGCALAFLWRQGKLPVARAALYGWAGLLGLIGFTFLWTQGPHRTVIYYGGYTLLALAAAGMLNAALVGSRRITAVFSWRPLRATGRVSYGLYLWHLMVLEIIVQHSMRLDRWSRAVLGLALSVAATLISWYCVEQPFLRVKARYKLRPSRVPVALPEPA